MRYRAFYAPVKHSNREVFKDAKTLEDLSPGAIIVIKVNDDDTREIIQVKENLTIKEQIFHDFALRYLEFKHDGGLTTDMINYMRENRA